MAAVEWEARFPTRSLELDGQQLLAAQLASGDEAAWLVTRPELWRDLTTLAQRLIARANEIREALRKGRDPVP
jgi:hypothetical protein